jgi:endonuclease-3 related protein
MGISVLQKKRKISSRLQRIYRKLFLVFGPQHWWPAQTPFEVIVGAILVQNTNWINVERAISFLKDKGALTPQRIKNMRLARLATLIKPAGYFNVKANRLKSFIRFLFLTYKGDVRLMRSQEPIFLRKQLLGVNGIGEETADSILLYALDKPFFVIDAYTRRIFSRHGVLESKVPYALAQKFFMDHLPQSVRMYNEYHALIVKLAKDFCRTKPLCEKCPLRCLFNKKPRQKAAR